jgi:hypothetical protein
MSKSKSKSKSPSYFLLVFIPESALIFNLILNLGPDFDVSSHGLLTPNEGIIQRNLKFWADVADKKCSAIPKNLGLGFDFRPCSEGDFLTGCP